jgi:predicted metalloprotease
MHVVKLRRRNTRSVIDRRGQGPTGGSPFPGGLGGLGSGRGMPIPIGKGGGIGLLLVIVLLAVCVAPKLLGDDSVLGGDVFSGLGQAQDSGGLDPATDPDAKLVQLVNDITADLEETWAGLFEGSSTRFSPAQLVLFTGRTSTGCGVGSAATGPFYCPADSRIYIDLGFFRELQDRFGAPGDFAQAYVIAHEYGHHIQNLLGINAEVQRQSQQDPGRANDLSIRLELQADCLAGVWGHTLRSQGELSPGDLEEALGAAEAVGDDRIQEATTGRIDPESWTHGSAGQRAHWFQVGFDSGDPNACDTFTALCDGSRSGNQHLAGLVAIQEPELTQTQNFRFVRR